ncbi:MAG: PQQ-dependent sugar dehydrogenase, partial [Candidatus Rokuibacteriota bacterium]
MRPGWHVALLLALVVPAVPVSAQPFSVGGDPRVNPDDFRVTTFASGLNFPYGLERLSDGSILVGTSSPTGGSFFASTGELIRLVDADGNGGADGPGTVLVSGLPGGVTAVRVAGSLAFVTSTQAGSERISVLRMGAAPADPYTLLGSIDFGFPSGWEHKSYALAVRPTGTADTYELFFNVGSSANDDQTSAVVAVSGLITGTLEGASIYRVTVHDGGGTPEVSALTRIAAGLRNAAGIAVHPVTGDLYFEDNGIDTPTNRNEPLSADELNRIAAADIGGTIEHFGFPDTYIEYRTGAQIGADGVQPLVAFQPIPPPDGSESEGPAEIAFAPPRFPPGLDNGVFMGFHGKFALAGMANEENPLVFYDLETGEYFHFIGNDEPGVGHLDGLLATDNALFVADLSSTGGLTGSGTGVIYKITAVKPLTVGRAGTGSGTVTSDPAGIDCGADCAERFPAGTLVALDAVPAAGSLFGGFSGDADCADGLLTMDAARSCTAVFTQV